MKPILVTNTTEWLRLAPVLEQQNYRWIGKGEKPTAWNPSQAHSFRVYVGEAIYKVLEIVPSWVITKETQTVDEYLSLQEPKTYFGFAQVYREIKDWEAKYETLLQAVKDAKELIISAHTDCYINSPSPLDSQAAYKHSLEILTEKTGI